MRMSFVCRNKNDNFWNSIFNFFTFSRSECIWRHKLAEKFEKDDNLQRNGERNIQTVPPKMVKSLRTELFSHIHKRRFFIVAGMIVASRNRSRPLRPCHVLSVTVMYLHRRLKGECSAASVNEWSGPIRTHVVDAWIADQTQTKWRHRFLPRCDLRFGSHWGKWSQTSVSHNTCDGYCFVIPNSVDALPFLTSAVTWSDRRQQKRLDF